MLISFVIIGWVGVALQAYLFIRMKRLYKKIFVAAPSASDNSSSSQWPKLHDIKVAVKPRGKADASNFHDAAVHYQAVKDTYLYMCNILGHSPH